MSLCWLNFGFPGLGLKLFWGTSLFRFLMLSCFLSIASNMWLFNCWPGWTIEGFCRVPTFLCLFLGHLLLKLWFGFIWSWLLPFIRWFLLLLWSKPFCWTLLFTYLLPGIFRMSSYLRILFKNGSALNDYNTTIKTSTQIPVIIPPKILHCISPMIRFPRLFPFWLQSHENNGFSRSLDF